MAVRQMLAWAALVAGALVIAFTWAPGGNRELIPETKRIAAEDFILKNSSGEEIRLSDFKGKAVLLNFWATWCGPCKVEIPWFKEFETAYKDQGFAVVGVSLDDDGWAVVKPFVESQQMNYTVVLGDQAMSKPYSEIPVLPTTYLIDREGKIAAIHSGLVRKDTYEYGIQQLLRR